MTKTLASQLQPSPAAQGPPAGLVPGPVLAPGGPGAVGGQVSIKCSADDDLSVTMIAGGRVSLR